MSGEEVMGLLEKGKGELVVTYGYLLRLGDEYFVSYDGNVWERTESPAVRREFE